MIAQAVVRHQLTLAVRLIDSTTGRGIPERNVRFYPEPVRGAPIARGDGVYLFLGGEREDFSLGVRVYGYEPVTVEILDRLDERSPIQEIYLLPVEYPVQGEEVLTLRGRLPGIQAIDAVSLFEANCCIREFDSRRRVMKVLNQHNVSLPYIHYGLVSKGKESYEYFQIEEELSLREIRLVKPLAGEYSINQPIARVVFGQTEVDGSYLFKGQESRNAVYLVRYLVGGKLYFQKMDFHHPEELIVREESAEMEEQTEGGE